jgi:cobalt-zinc-cadmium efflux system membrane fusion protein
VLGDHREKVLTVYSAYVLADNLLRSNEELFKKAAVSENVLRQRESNREIARDKYIGACDVARYTARQALEKARENQAYERRLMEVAQRKLDTLVGPFSKVEVRPESSAGDWTELTRFSLFAPFQGTVEERKTSDSQRVTAGTLLFTFADTSVLEVEADVREEAWRDVAPYFETGAGQVLKVRVPFGGNDREFEATVEYVGRAVDPESRAVAIHAEFNNSQLRFKPGMLARITIPAGKPEEALVVPAAALRTHDRQDFVFVEDEREPRKFRRIDVKVGRQTAEGATIVAGLNEGQRVVVEGGFLLKSELLLEPEEE